MSLTIRAQSLRSAELIDALRTMMRPAEMDRGCASATLYLEVGNPECAYYLEEWTSEEDLKRSLQAGHFARLVAIMEIAAVPPTLKFSHVVDADGLEFAARICGAA